MLNVDQHHTTCTHIFNIRNVTELVNAELYVSGGGGTDISFLIEALKCLVGRVWTDGGMKVVVAAPTGLAAFNVGGLTIHRLFQLSIEHEGETAEYWSL